MYEYGFYAKILLKIAKMTLVTNKLKKSRLSSDV